MKHHIHPALITLLLGISLSITVNRLHAQTPVQGSALRLQPLNRNITNSHKGAVQDTSVTLKELKMQCDDSTVVDHQNHWTILYGHAVVTYKNMVIKGDHIVFDELGKRVQASSKADGLGGKTLKDAVYTSSGKLIKAANALEVNLQNGECKVLSK